MGRIRALLVLLMLSGSVVGCSSSQSPGGGLLAPAPKDSGPAADSPLHLLDAYRWSWENLNDTRYRELLSSDYIFEFSGSDSSGSPYQGNPWRRADELIFAHDLFAAGSPAEAPASNITLTFSGTVVGDDFRPGKASPARKSISSQVNLTIQKTDGTGFQCTGPVIFYVVRGDSADVPADLGAGPWADRWFVDRLIDESPAVQPWFTASPQAATPTRRFTLGMLRSLYR